MILIILFIVFMALWFASLINSELRVPYADVFPFLSVLTLFFIVHGLRL